MIAFTPMVLLRVVAVFRRCKLRADSGFLLLLAGLVCAGCTTSEVSTFERVSNASAEQAYIKPGANFSRYRRLYAYPLEIYYREGAGAPTPENLERMRGIFADAFLAALDGKYEIVDKPATDALAVRASLVDLRGAAAGDDVPATGRLRSLVANGQLSLFMELSDSVTGEVLARAGDRDRSEPDAAAVSSVAGAYERDVEPWPKVELAAARWAAMFRDFLDENLGR